MQSLRQLWLKVHRWVALSVGWILAIVGLTGAILVVAQPLDRWAHPELFQSHTVVESMAQDAPYAPVLARLQSDFGAKTTFTFKPPRTPEETLWVLVRGKTWRGTVYIDPVTGLEQGRRGEQDGFVNTLFKFHSSLMFDKTGKTVLAWIALSYLLLLVTGVIVWWPKRWPPSMNIVLDKGLLRAFFDIHRIGGVVLGLVIAVSVATGAYMAWRPLGQYITMATGEKPVKAPVIDKTTLTDAPLASIDTFAANAQAQFPTDAIGFIQIPEAADKLVRVRMRIAGDPHPNGQTSVWMHPQTGAVVSVQRFDQFDTGAGMVSWVYPLHTGVLGGVLLEAVIFVSGLMLGMLGITGIWLWWKRRQIKRASARHKAA